MRKLTSMTDQIAHQLDQIDLSLIAELRRDGRASLSELAQILGIARATVRLRLEKLQERGVIRGFSVVLSGDGHKAPVRGLVMVGIEGRGADRIVRHLRGIPEVEAVHTTIGRWDLILEVGAQSLATLDEVLAKIRSLEGVTTSETHLLMTSKR